MSDYKKIKPGSEGLAGFNWDELELPSQRIERNTEKYRDVPVAEAFAQEYKFKLSSKFKNQREQECKDLHVGDIIDLVATSITKKGVLFDSPYKEEIVCSANLYNYTKFKDSHNVTLTCKVLSKTDNKVVVDPFAVLFDKWVDSKLCIGRRGMEPSYQQYDMDKDNSSLMKGLHLIKGAGNESVKGGYSGRLRVDTLSDFVGQDVYIDAFIPGSQIVLNIEPDFSRWEGKDVQVFILNYLNKPGNRNSTSMSVICSAKEVKKFDGQKRMVKIFNDYTEDNDDWKSLTGQVFNGIVTGVLHRSKICGVFVEIPELNVTGMVEMAPSELVGYKPQQQVRVMWDHFIEPVRFNKDIGQMQHLQPYVIEEGHYLKEFNLKPIFKWAE